MRSSCARKVRLSVFVLAGAIAGVVAAPARAQPHEAAVVSAIIGEVLATGPAVTVLPLAPRSKVSVGDLIVTGGGARVELLFVDGSKMTLGESTQIKVSRYDIAGGERHASFELSRGLARSVVAKMSDTSSFVIRTPTAIAAVRSTVFCVEYTHDKGTEGVVVEGSLRVTDRGGGIALLEPGFGITVAPGQARNTPEAWPVTRIDAMRARAMIPAPVSSVPAPRPAE